MHRAVIAFFWSLLIAGPAWASPLVVWLEPQVPADRDVKRAEALTEEPGKHFASPDLEFPPAAPGADDTASYDALRKAVLAAKARWTEFDVELSIARDLDKAISGVTVIRDRRDLQELTDARLVQGAAVAVAFSPTDFREGADAAPFRAEVPGGLVNAPWLEARAIDHARAITPGDLVDGATYSKLQELQDKLSSLPDGYLDLSAIPRDAAVVVDGVLVDRGAMEVSVRPGHHYVHVIRGDVVGGRQVVAVESGITAEVPPLVTESEIAEAKATLLAGTTTGFPATVKKSLEAIEKQNQGEIWVAALDDGKLVLKPYLRTVKRTNKHLVTVVGTGDVGGGAIVTPLFDDSNGDTVTAPAVQGGLGLEIGITYFALLGGFDLAFTPGQTMTYGNVKQHTNVATSVLPQPWGGAGFYILRPSQPKATLLLAGTWGWNAPAHYSLGGRVTVGIPVDDEGTWFRITVGGNTAAKSQWDTGNAKTPMQVLFARFGFGARF